MRPPPSVPSEHRALMMIVSCNLHTWSARCAWGRGGVGRGGGVPTAIHIQLFTVRLFSESRGVSFKKTHITSLSHVKSRVRSRCVTAPPHRIFSTRAHVSRCPLAVAPLEPGSRAPRRATTLRESCFSQLPQKTSVYSTSVFAHLRGNMSVS